MARKPILISAACLLGAVSALLGGCGVRVDADALTAQADYSIDIALPYATAIPDSNEQEEVQPLVIDAEGSVTLNDSSTILQGDAPVNTYSDTSYNSLRQGNTGLAVQALQTRLQELGYYSANISGVFDANTEVAVRRFEQTYGTMQTGVATAELQARLFAPDAPVYGSEAYNAAVISQYKVLQRGDVGSSVYALQQRLRNLNYPISDLTGTFDNDTANAVMLFYEAYGLSASDVASVAFQRELYSDAARPYGNATGETSASDSLTILSPEAVAQIQRRLIELGYLTGEATGEQDVATQIAVKLFEEACGQLPSGTLSDNILSRLQSDSAPRFETLSGEYSNLIEGSSGEDVQRLQQRLVDLGFATGTPNGQYGAATSASIRIFQAANGMEETGIGSAYLQAVLYSSFALNINGQTIGAAAPKPTPTPEPEPTVEAEPEVSAAPATALVLLTGGSEGDDVLAIQNRLTELGYVTSVTGTYDELTQRAVTAFQQALGLEPSGDASPDLQLLLLSDAAPRSGIRFHEEVQTFRKLSLGDEGEDVAYLQRRLWQLDYLERNAIKDSVGVFNDATQQAVIALQTALNFAEADGAASAELQCYLMSDYSAPDE